MSPNSNMQKSSALQHNKNDSLSISLLTKLLQQMALNGVVVVPQLTNSKELESIQMGGTLQTVL